MDFIAIDFETANEHRTSACSLGIATVKNNEIVDIKEWLINPYPDVFNEFNVAIHGITKEDVASAPTFDKLWPEIAPYFDNKIIVAHNASFDISVLKNTLSHYCISPPNFEILCTYRISQAAFPHAGSHRLNIICKLLEIDLKHHNARSDAKACAEILCKLMSTNNIDDLKDLKKLYNLLPGYWHNNQYYKPCRIRSRNCSDFEQCSDLINDKDDNYCINDDFNGKCFVFTGTLLSMQRDKAFDVVARGGGIPQKNINKKTDYLVLGIQDYKKLNGSSTSSKMKKAYELQKQGCPLQIISEDEFISMIDDELYSLCFKS